MTRHGLLARVVFAVAAAVVANVALSLSSQHHNYVAVTLIVFCLIALVEALATSMSAVAPPDWRSDHVVEKSSPPTEGSLARYQRLLERQRVSRDPDSGLQRQLLALAERRLEQVHGLSRDSDPDQVQLRLGPILGELMSPRRLTPSDVNRIIDRIEEL